MKYLAESFFQSNVIKNEVKKKRIELDLKSSTKLLFCLQK
jgi:hypothetical protein